MMLTDITVSELTQPTIYTIQKSSVKLSSYKALHDQVEGATIYQDNTLTIENVRIEFPEDLFTPEMFNFSPATHQCLYLCNRKYWRVGLKGKEIIMWSNVDGSIITMTTL